MKNLLINFVDWYLETNEGKTANFFVHTFKSDRDFFIAELSDYAVEFALAYGYNPFKVDKDKLDILKADIYRKGTPFSEFSESKSNHVPRALFGKNNYQKFLDTLYTEKKSSASLKAPVVRKQTNVYHYEKEELQKNFIFRLITQDRYYEFLCFPISVLKKIFYGYDRREFFDNWINTQIDNITVYTSPSTKILFKDVETLDISKDGIALINGKHNLHTAVSVGGAVIEAYTTTLQDIVIDHIESFVNVLYTLKDQLPALQIIHNVLENINDGRVSNYEALKNAGNYLVSNVEFTPSELDGLEKDMNLILSKIELQLMDKGEHRGKKK
ncbi:hypothetical protein [Bacteroides sp. 519]|uniref:hypothetical protein n=1 Tax=Bacteroides sp. 519 TaxID=2302937 RepID=UPI0013D0852A|nr:hypothetical protein [Bacteroides sp. 519]NDV57640.1 hypothetical protein [Bacteroides sp. 519]